MIYSIIRRASDGLVAQPQTSTSPAAHPANRVEKASARFGGTWAYQEIEENVLNSIRAFTRQGKAVFLNNNTLAIQGPPVLSKTENTISVTVTCDVNDAKFSGSVNWECEAPDGSVVKTSENAVNGIDSWEIVTGQDGTYTVRVVVPEFGFASIDFEGV